MSYQRSVAVVVTFEIQYALIVDGVPVDPPEDYQKLANDFVATAIKNTYQKKCPPSIVPVHIAEERLQLFGE